MNIAQIMKRDDDVDVPIMTFQEFKKKFHDINSRFHHEIADLVEAKYGMSVWDTQDLHRFYSVYKESIS